jgi:HPt (histidine-containing phosphotransfer) domain-containing protein
MQRQDIQPALDHLESALHASCTSLIALQSTRIAAREMTWETLPIEAQIAEAIASVQEAIAELRAMHDVETSPLAFGFVMAADPEGARPQIRRRAARR